MSQWTVVNEIDVAQMRGYIDKVACDSQVADRQPLVVARWLGQSRSEVTSMGTTMHLGGDGELNPMRALLGTLAACDVDLIAMHASLMGIEIAELRVEVGGYFHVARFLGLDSEQPPGYQHIDYTVHLHVRNANEAQIARLRRLCETGSPVGDTLNRPVPTRLHFEVHVE